MDFFRRFFTSKRSKLVFAILSSVAIFAIVLVIIFIAKIFGAGEIQNVQVNISDTVIGSKQNPALNVNPYNLDWEHAFWSAQMATNPSFETDWYGNGTKPNTDSQIFSTVSSPWVVQGAWSGSMEGKVTPSIDHSEKISGSSSQKIHIDPSLASDVELVNFVNPALVIGHTYRAKAQVKGSPGGSAKLIIDTNAGEQRSGTLNISSGWQTISFDFTPTSAMTMSGLILRIAAKGDIWVDDFIFWDVTDTNTNGLSTTLINRLKEIKPPMLRWGSLYTNGLSLARVTFRPWSTSYGPPPDFDIATFLELNKAVGSIPYITIPASFTDDSFRTNVLPDLTRAHQLESDQNCNAIWSGTTTVGQVLPGMVNQLESSYAEHLSLLDYLTARSGTSYGDKALSQGFTDWSGEFSKVYFELGNELWNSMSKAYNMWDCQKKQDNYGQYALNRMQAMKGSPSWKANFKVGFNGQWGNWSEGQPSLTYSWDVITATYTKNYADFYSDAPYWPSYIRPFNWCTPGNLPSNPSYYNAVYATNDRLKRDVPYQYNAVKDVVGHDIEHIWYEINAETFCDTDYGEQVQKQYNPMFFRLHSIGTAIGQLDNFAAFPSLGITYGNEYQAVSRDLYGNLVGYPDYGRRPEWFAFQMLEKAGSEMLTTSVAGSPTWDDTSSGLSNLAYVHAYGYEGQDSYSVLIINRDQNNSYQVQINFPNHNYSNNASVYSLTSGNINDNNDASGATDYTINENITLENQSINNFTNGYNLLVAPFSAYLLQVSTQSGSSITLVKQVDKTSASSGETITYTINYQVGITSATSAKIEDPIPFGTSFISATKGGVSDGTKVTWNLGSLAVGASGSVSFQVKVE